jgi:hypothetical protein
MASNTGESSDTELLAVPILPSMPTVGRLGSRLLDTVRA